MMMTTATSNTKNNKRSSVSALNDNINASSGGTTHDGDGSGSGGGIGVGGGSGGNGSLTSSSTLKKGPWTPAEDAILIEYVRKHGEGNWNSVQKNSGLSRCGKSCRLRWANHLRPNLKKGPLSLDEELLILELHCKHGNKSARMAPHLPGRTDNEIKNYWNTRFKRRQRAGLPIYPIDIHRQTSSFHHQHRQTSVLPHQSLQVPPSQFASVISSSTQQQLQQQQLQRQQQQQQQQHHQNTTFGSSLPLFDPLNLSTQTHLSGHQNNNNTNNTSSSSSSTYFLSAAINGFKRFRGQNFGYSQQFFPTQHQTLTPPSSGLFNHNFSSQYLPPPLQFNPENYDLMSPQLPLMHSNSHDQTNHMSPPDLSFSFNLELPSNQMSQPAANTAASGNTSNDMECYNINTSLDDLQNNSGLLDTLLQQAEAMGGRSTGGHGSRKERLVSEKQQVEEENGKEKCRIDGLVGDAPPSGTVLFSQHTTTTTPPAGSSNQWGDQSSPANSSTGMKMKGPMSDEMNWMEDDDFSSLLNSIPSTMLVSEFIYNDGGETSNSGKISGVIDEDIGIDMQLLPSNTNSNTIMNNSNTFEYDWNLGAWNWDVLIDQSSYS